jgi:hypothetical protein
VSPEGKECIVHVNRLKRAVNQDVWKEKNKNYKKNRITRRVLKEEVEQEEEEETMVSPGAIVAPEPMVVNQQPKVNSPREHLPTPQWLDPPDSNPRRNEQKVDPALLAHDSN